MEHETDNTKALLWRAFIDFAGGVDTMQALRAYHGQGRSITKLARDRGISKSTMSRRMTAMRGTLAKYGLLPTTWNQ